MDTNNALAAEVTAAAKDEGAYAALEAFKAGNLAEAISIAKFERALATLEALVIYRDRTANGFPAFTHF